MTRPADPAEDETDDKRRNGRQDPFKKKPTRPADREKGEKDENKGNEPQDPFKEKPTRQADPRKADPTKDQKKTRMTTAGGTGQQNP